MITTLKVSDETYQQYVEHNKQNPRLAMEQQLKRFEKFAPADRVIILPNEIRKQLEELMGETIDSPEKLLWFFKNRLSVSVDGASVTLRPGQAKHIIQEAQALHQEVLPYVEKKVKSALDKEYGLY
jgi:hypothetical protein